MNFSSLNTSINLHLNDVGNTAFWATLTGSGVDNTNGVGIWSERSGTLELVARSGDQAPGTPSGVNFLAMFYGPSLNAAGQTAFWARLTGSGVDQTNDYGIWSEGSGTLDLVAREGSHAPGTPDGVIFGRSIFPSGLSQPALNAAGQTAFHAVLTGSGADSTNDEGIWATDLSGTLQLIARKGDDLEVAANDFRTIASFGLWNFSFDFNDRGQLAFWASFTDGSSGAFVSNLVAVPEPSGLVLFDNRRGRCLVVCGSRSCRAVTSRYPC